MTQLYWAIPLGSTRDILQPNESTTNEVRRTCMYMSHAFMYHHWLLIHFQIISQFLSSALSPSGIHISKSSGKALQFKMFCMSTPAVLRSRQNNEIRQKSENHFRRLEINSEVVKQSERIDCQNIVVNLQAGNEEPPRRRTKSEASSHTLVPIQGPSKEPCDEPIAYDNVKAVRHQPRGIQKKKKKELKAIKSRDGNPLMSANICVVTPTIGKSWLTHDLGDNDFLIYFYRLRCNRNSKMGNCLNCPKFSSKIPRKRSIQI